MVAYFERFALEMTMSQAKTCSHPGPCDEDVEHLMQTTKMCRQLDNLDPDILALELADYGAWDGSELEDVEQNKRRIVWIAAGNITESN